MSMNNTSSNKHNPLSSNAVPTPPSEVWRDVTPAPARESKQHMVRGINEEMAKTNLERQQPDAGVLRTNQMTTTKSSSLSSSSSSSSLSTREHISTRVELEKSVKATQRKIMVAQQSRQYERARRMTNEYKELISLRQHLPSIPELESKVKSYEQQFNDHMDIGQIDEAELLDNEMKRLKKQISIEKKAEEANSMEVHVTNGTSGTTENKAVRVPPKTKHIDEDLVSQGKLRTRSYNISSSGGPLVERMDYSRDEGPSDRLVVLQGAPLVWSDKFGNYQTLPLPDFDTEQRVILEAMKDAKEMTGANVDVIFETATTDRLGAFLQTGGSPVLHFSCHGHPEYLAIEDGWGALQSLLNSDLRDFVSRGSGILKVVFISACYSGPAGEAFLEAGVQHVVCCDQNERLRDTAAIEFAKHFYRSLACGKSLRESFELSCQAVKISPNVTDPSVEMKKFRLLPEKAEDDPYHDVAVFEFNRPRIRRRQGSFTEEWTLPPPPQIFLGRELAMFRILEKLKAARLVRLTGVKEIGKTSLAKAVCKYVHNRMRSFRLDDIAWLPPLENTPFVDHVSCTLRDVFMGISDDSCSVDAIPQYLGKIVKEIHDKFVLIAIDGRKLGSGSKLEKLNLFLKLLFENTFNTKVILVCPSVQELSFSVGRYVALSTEVEPLEFKYAALLFGKVCAFVHLKHCHIATTPDELAQLLVPKNLEHATKITPTMSKRCTDIFSFVGTGIPGRIHAKATAVTKEDFDKLIRIAMRPEFDGKVDSRVELEKEYLRVSKKMTIAVNNQDFLKAQEFKDVKDELLKLRQNFPTLAELITLETATKEELDEAIASQDFLRAQELKKKLEDLRDKIKNEKEARYDEENDDYEDENMSSDGDRKDDENQRPGDSGGDFRNVDRDDRHSGSDDRNKGGNDKGDGKDNSSNYDPHKGNDTENSDTKKAAGDHDDDSQKSDDRHEGELSTAVSQNAKLPDHAIVKRLQKENAALKQQVRQLQDKIVDYQGHVNRLEFTIAKLRNSSKPNEELDSVISKKRGVLPRLNRQEESAPSIDVTEDSSASSGSRYWMEKFGATKVAAFQPKEATMQERASTQQGTATSSSSNTGAAHQNAVAVLRRSHGTKTLSSDVSQLREQPLNSAVAQGKPSIQSTRSSAQNSNIEQKNLLLRGSQAMKGQRRVQFHSLDELPSAISTPPNRTERRSRSDTFQNPVDTFQTDSIDEIIKGAAAIYVSSADSLPPSAPSVTEDNEIRIQQEVERIEKAYGQPIPQEVKVELTKPSFVSEVSFWQQPASLVPNQNELSGDSFDEIFQRASSLYGKPIPEDVITFIRSSARARQLLEDLSSPIQARPKSKKETPPNLDTVPENDWQVAFYSELTESDETVEEILVNASHGCFISDELKFSIVGAFRIFAATGASTSNSPEQEEFHLKELLNRAAKSYGKPIPKRLQSAICVSSLASLNASRHNSLVSTQAESNRPVSVRTRTPRDISIVATFSIHPTSGIMNIHPFSLVITQGSVVDFAYPKQPDRAGIVYATNEQCSIPVNADLSLAGGHKVLEDISNLPLIAETRWGGVRCMTGESKNIGPNEYGYIHVPIVILAVGPSYYAEVGHTHLQQSDALLRAAYRSSLARAKHLQLEAIAFSLLSTGDRSATDHARTLHIALQVLSEFPGYKELREIHVFGEDDEIRELENKAFDLGLQTMNTAEEEGL